MLLPVLTAQDSIVEQRKSLPAAPSDGCSDDIAGEWQGYTSYNPNNGAHNQTMLTIERGDSPGALKGTVRARTWDGTPDQKVPPLCDGVNTHYVVSFAAEGTVEGSKVTFGGVGAVTTEEIVCVRANDYNLDHFTGTLDLDRQEFITVNNDGFAAKDHAVVFRRVECLEAPPVDYSVDSAKDEPRWSRPGCGFF
jgi:hypothetical protein